MDRRQSIPQVGDCCIQCLSQVFHLLSFRLGVRRDIIYSKGKTLSGPVSDPKDLPKWNHDRSSTGEALEKDSEVILHPQAVFRDPFHRAKNILKAQKLEPEPCYS
ncbi:hypothetical protein SUGI_0866510 [Cryptomeria japonica]|nr:hypothetical protein SUGI_0866510 [Cryptomeria japonica]